MALNLENKGLEYSPFAERSKEAASRRFSKRKCSKSLLDMFERESSSHLENDATNDTLFNKQNLSVLLEESPNMDHCLNLNKRFKSLGTNNNSNSFRLIEWENPNNVSFTSQISLPPDWDDSAARSSFDSPFMPKESVNKRISNVYPVDFSHLNDICPTKGKVSSQRNAKSHSAQLPRDMRLGTKLRLVSERPFPWLEKIGTPGVYPVNPYIPSCDYEEAMNTIKLVDQKREQNQIKSNNITNPSANALILLQSAAIFHQCPSVGSVQMFPRRNVDSKSTLKSANLQSIEANFMEDLTQQWLEAFDFLFQTWLSGKRKCFYLCSPQFTIYFSSEVAKPKQQKMHRPMAKTPTKTPQKVKNNSAEKKTPKGKENCGTPNQKKILTSPFVWAKSPPRPSNLQESTEGEQQQQQQPLIVLTPTSTGFRQILHKNGVDFSLPFKPEFVDLSQEECPKDFLPNEEDQSAQMDHDEWLKDIGISPRTTLRLRQSASELDAQQTQTNDGNSSSAGSGRVPSNPSPPTEACRSTIVIRGREDAQALHKLLSTQHQLISTKTGPQAGLPPTLISHSPFRHSKQSELTMNSQLIKKGSQVKYVMEMERGPILPSTFELLFDFVHQISGSSSTSAPPNRVKLQLIGRSQCNGINEALNKEAVNDGVGGTQQHQFVNCNELEWDGRQFEFL